MVRLIILTLTFLISLGFSACGEDEAPDPAGAGTENADPETTVTTCEATIPAAASGTCSVTPGDPGVLLIEGDLIVPDGIIEGGQVLAVNGTITCVGCQCAEDPAAVGATRVSCADGVVSPGLINAHDHITFTQSPPAPHGDERYDQRCGHRRALH